MKKKFSLQKVYKTNLKKKNYNKIQFLKKSADFRLYKCVIFWVSNCLIVCYFILFFRECAWGDIVSALSERPLPVDRWAQHEHTRKHSHSRLATREEIPVKLMRGGLFCFRYKFAIQ